MIFEAATSLSELVWSPKKGASIKCADCVIPDKNFSCLCGMGSKNLVLSPPQSITAKEIEDIKNVDEQKLGSLQMESRLPRKVSDKVNQVMSPRSHKHNLASSGGVEEMSSKMELSSSNSDKEAVNSDKKESNIHRQIEKASIPDPDIWRSAASSSTKVDKPKFDLARTEPECRGFSLGTNSSPIEVNEDVHSGNSHTAGTQDALSPDVSTVKECKFSDTQNPLVTSHEIEKNEIGFISPMGKQEYTAENELQLLQGEIACAEVSIRASQAADEEGKQSSYQNGRILPSSNDVTAVEASPNSSYIPLSRRKDKEKVVFDEEINEKILIDEDNSHESVESCNSTGLFPAGKRKWSFEQQMIVASKRVKQQHHESSHFGLLQKQDSSFMNWISNMVKGLSKSSSDETPSLALTMRTHHGNQSTETSTGFQTIFKALYYPSSGVQDDKVLSLGKQLGESSKELDNISSPSTGDDDGKCKQIVLSNDKNPGMYIDGEGPSTLPNNPSENMDIVHENCKENSTKIRNLCNVACNLTKVGVISSSSSLQNDLDSLSQGKDSCKLDSVHHLNKIDRSNSLENIWITRFSPKVSGFMINSPKKSQQHVSSPAESLNNRTKTLPRAQNCVVSRKEKGVLEDNCHPSMENARKREQLDQKKSKSKLNTVQNSQRFKNSKALASVFWRRLDALRNIIPSEVDGNSIHATTICFFCGIVGHKLQDCSEITGSEIEELLKKFSPCDGKEELSCLCIQCFQLNHWAIECPYSSSSKNTHLDGKNPTLDTEANVDTNVNSKTSKTVILDGKASFSKPVKKDVVGNNFFDGTAGKNTSKELIFNGKQSASGSTENVRKQNQITTICDFVHRHIPAVPRGTFEAIKRLRLSRTDILKWMKSPMLITCIEGFFLRLRLQKWDEGLGGTGYFVACLNGTSGERSFRSHKHTLSVDVAGFKSLIETWCISNHDYTEDELMAWWCATIRGGGKMPLEEDLKLKFEEKKKLGF